MWQFWGDGERIAQAILRIANPTSISVVTPPSNDVIQVGKVDANPRPRLVWCSDRNSILVSDRLMGKWGLWCSQVDGGDSQRIDLKQNDINEVRLAEDGKRIAFRRQILRPNELWAYRF